MISNCCVTQKSRQELLDAGHRVVFRTVAEDSDASARSVQCLAIHAIPATASLPSPRRHGLVMWDLEDLDDLALDFTCLESAAGNLRVRECNPFEDGNILAVLYLHGSGGLGK